MITDPVAHALHQKASLGGPLSPEEKERLAQWYASNDRDEAIALTQSSKTHEDEMHRLQRRIDDANAKIVEEAQKLQTLELENQKLQNEISNLERQLLQKKTRQPA